MGRRGHRLIAAAFVAGAGLLTALVVLPNGGSPDGAPGTSGGAGTVALEPVLVQPRVPGTAIAAARSRASGGGSNRPAAGAPNHAQTGPLGVDVGSVGGLFPGHRVELGVSYVNPYSFPIAIHTVRVTATGTARCTDAQLTPTHAAHVRIPSRSSIPSTVQVGMRRTAPDACQGVRFAVRLQVTAVRL